MFSFDSVLFSDHTDVYFAYTRGLRLVDTYWENVILAADVYSISMNGECIGYCSVCNQREWEEYRYLTSFFLQPEAMVWLKPAFEALLQTLKPVAALAVTSDEPFLSLCMDYCNKSMPYAYFFDYLGASGVAGTLAPQAMHALPTYSADLIRPAVEADIPDLLASGFYHGLDIHNAENRIYVLRDAEGAYLGTGHIARMLLNRTWGAVGMCTSPQHRRKGVGRSIIAAMVDITLQNGLVPIAGCKWVNAASRATLESCGFGSRTRYLKFLFE